MVQLVGTPLTTATQVSKTAKETAKASGLTVAAPLETTLVVTPVPTATMDSAETVALIAAGAGLQAPAPAIPTQIAGVRAPALQAVTRQPLAIGTATSPSVSQEDFHILTTTNPSVCPMAGFSRTQLQVIPCSKVTPLARSATS